MSCAYSGCRDERDHTGPHSIVAMGGRSFLIQKSPVVWGGAPSTGHHLETLRTVFRIGTSWESEFVVNAVVAGHRMIGGAVGQLLAPEDCNLPTVCSFPREWGSETTMWAPRFYLPADVVDNDRAAIETLGQVFLQVSERLVFGAELRECLPFQRYSGLPVLNEPSIAVASFRQGVQLRVAPRRAVKLTSSVAIRMLWPVLHKDLGT